MSHFERITSAERTTILRLLGEGCARSAILSMLQTSRSKNKDAGPNKSAVNRYIAGDAYQPGTVETRGRKVSLNRRALAIADAQRKGLIKKAGNEYTVTWEDVHKATLKDMKKKRILRRCDSGFTVDTLARRMREEKDVRSRPARARAARTEKDEKLRWKRAKAWVKYPTSWWKDNVHAYIDNKTFVLARSAGDKRKVRQA